MSHHRLINAVFNEPWLVEAGTHEAIQNGLLSHLESKATFPFPQADERRLAQGARVGERTVELYQVRGNGVAHIEVSGTLGKKLSWIDLACAGGYDYLALAHALEQASLDSRVNSILIDFDSGGGTVMGVTETAMIIAQIDQIKPVYGFTETKSCSASYWLMSQCRHIFTTPSAMIGSIGVYSARMVKNVEIDVIKAGKYKALGIQPLTDEEREVLQAGVIKKHEKFKSAITSKREVNEEAMEGLVYDGEEAVENGLADSLVLTFDEVINEIG